MPSLISKPIEAGEYFRQLFLHLRTSEKMQNPVELTFRSLEESPNLGSQGERENVASNIQNVHFETVSWTERQ